VHLGKRIATAEGRLEDDAGKLYAHATTTCIVLSDGG
jgi:acyl-coenzyme A thioesterase PaaI-like protein